MIYTSFVFRRVRRKFLAFTLLLATCRFLSAATVGYWRFENGTAFLTDSGGNVNGPFTLTNEGANNANDSVALPATGAGKAFSRTIPLTGGANAGAAFFTPAETPADAFSVAHNAAFNGSAFTIEAIVNLASEPAIDESRTIASDYGSTPADRRFRLSVLGKSSTNSAQVAGSIRLMIGSTRAGVMGVSTFTYISSHLTIGDDYYVGMSFALTGNGGARCTLYLKNLTTNAPLITSPLDSTVSDWNSVNTTVAPFRIGAATNVTGELGWDGLIDEVRFSDTALNREQLLIVPPPPVITLQPVAQTVTVGDVVLFQVEAQSVTPPLYQWFSHGVLVPSATSFLGAFRTTGLGSDTLSCRVTNDGGSVTSDIANLTVTTSSDPGKLSALSIRGQVGSGSDILIAGIITETSTVKTVIQAVGPTLGVNAPELAASVLKDPRLELYQFFKGNFSKMTENDDWAVPSSGAAAVTDAASRSGATPLTNTASRDAALLSTLSPGVYTANVSGADGGTGIALIQAYVVPSATDTGALSALSIRGGVGTGGGVLIAGIIVGGNTAKTVLIQAVGPTLGELSPDIASKVLVNPKLELYQLVNGSFVKIRENDDWGGDPYFPTFESSSGATPLSSATSKDAALLITLPPGVYTANVSGVASTSGVVLLQVYLVP